MKDLDLEMLMDDFKKELDHAKQQKEEAHAQGNIIAETFQSAVEITTLHHMRLLRLVMDKKELSKKITEMLND